MSTADLPVASRRSGRTRGWLMRRHPRDLGVALGLHGLAAVAGLAAPWLLGDLVEDPHGTTAGTVDRIALAIAASSSRRRC